MKLTTKTTYFSKIYSTKNTSLFFQINFFKEKKKRICKKFFRYSRNTGDKRRRVYGQTSDQSHSPTQRTRQNCVRCREKICRKKKSRTTGWSWDGVEGWPVWPYKFSNRREKLINPSKILVWCSYMDHKLILKSNAGVFRDEKNSHFWFSREWRCSLWRKW